MTPAFVTSLPASANISSFRGLALSAQFVKRPNILFHAAKNSTRAHIRWMMQFGILYSSVTGNTEEVAQMMKNYLGSSADDPVEISDATAEKCSGYSALIVGAPTWNTGADSERSGTTWDEFIYDDINNYDLKDKPVAVFGLGDTVGYGENFCDAIEELHDQFQKCGSKMIGYTSTDGIEFEESKSVRDGKFLGLAVDMVNYGDEMEGRISDWCKQIKSESNV